MTRSVWTLTFVCLVLLGIVWFTDGCDRRSVESVYLDVDSVEMQEICFDELGCFNNSLYCHRFGFPPNHPVVIDTKFYLYTKWTRLEPDLLNTADIETFLRFSPRKETKIIIHGFMESHDLEHIINLKDAILKKGDYNVIVVNWSGGGTGHYHTARLNIRVVGRQTANLMQFLVDTYSYSMAIHIIGHSLGAHAAGYAGEEFTSVDRISGLDPAGPWFVDELDRCRLDASDASFVDVIHTDGDSYGFGLLDQLGHQDFYPNGGEDMPGCGMFSIFCSHRRSIQYFTNSLNCSFPAYRCDSWDEFKSDSCQPQTCNSGECSQLGFHADRSSTPGKYYLRTNKYQPFC